MTRHMQDSVSVSALIPGADLYAGYVDGRYANVAAMRRRFPHTRIVAITVLGQAGADVCDCETGDLTPVHAAQWAAREAHAGRHPTVYCNASTWPSVRRAVAATEVHSSQMSYWIAQYDGHAVIPAGAVAKQYIDHGPHGENVDLSVVADYWPGVDPAPVPPKPPAPHPQPAPVGEDDTVKLIAATGLPDIYVTDFLSKRHLTPAEYDALKQILGGPVELPASVVNAIPNR